MSDQYTCQINQGKKKYVSTSQTGEKSWAQKGCQYLEDHETYYSHQKKVKQTYLMAIKINTEIQ